MPIFSKRQGFKLGYIFVLLYRLLFIIKLQFPFVFNIRNIHVSISVLLFQFILAYEDCYLFIELIDLK
jgi:hypothetical protein